MKNIINYILNIIFPPKCYICKNIGNDPICTECLEKIEYLNKWENNNYYISEYSGTIKKAIKQLKFRNKMRIGPVLGKIISDNVPLINADYIIPVPLHRKRQKQRGFNQSDLISRQLSEKFNIPILTDVLLRTKETKPQFGLHKNERFNNIKGAFSLTDMSQIKNKNVILIDDIYTTGSTISECKQALISAGIGSVFTIILSKAVLK